MTVTCRHCGTGYPQVLPACPSCHGAGSGELPPPRKAARWLGLLFFLPGLGMGYLTFQLVQDSSRFVREGQRAEAVVTELIRSKSGSSSSKAVYYPEVRFTTPEGQVHTARGRTGSNPPAVQVGQRVRLFYDRTDPQQVRLDDFSELWLAPLITALLCPLFVLVGLHVMSGKANVRRGHELLAARERPRTPPAPRS